MFKIEDERYEIDQVINLNNDSIKVLEKAMKEIEEKGNDYKLNKKDFTKARESWIFQVFSKNVKMIELFHTHPTHTIPVALNSIKEFQKEFLKKKEDMQSVWKQESIKHWAKSLDHKSFYFRMNEKRAQVAREFQSKLKSLIEHSKIWINPVQQRIALQFYTGFEGQEAKALNLNVNEHVDPNHPMLLQDPIYLENFSKLPHFRFLINSTGNNCVKSIEDQVKTNEFDEFSDEECLKTVMKILYLWVDKNSAHQSKQKSFLASFGKYFLNLGFVEKNIKELKQIDLPDSLIDSIKNGKDFYSKYIEGSLNLDEIFKNFFFESSNDVITNAKSARNLNTNEPNQIPSEDILESDDEPSNEEEKEEPNVSSQPYIFISNNASLEERILTSRFLPPLMKNQILYYGTIKYYVVLRFLFTLFERIKLAKNIVGK